MYLRWIVCLLLVQEFWKHVVIANYSPTLSTLNDTFEDETLELEPINGTTDYRINIKKDVSGKPWYTDRKERYIIRCVRPAKCEKLQNSTCFGSKIPYRLTSVQLSNEESQENSLKKLYQLEALRTVPECWAVIQPFLCAVYIPRCTKIKEREYVFLPSLEMCKVTLKPCRILYDTDFFPQNLRCDEKVFPCINCSNDVREMKFNATGQCVAPLVPTESPINHFPAIEGCGLQCKDPLYTDEEHESVHTLIFWGTIICMGCNAFVIATFQILDLKHLKHPARNILYISICFLCNWIGWMLQFLPEHRENIVCRRDGTLRHSEPSAGENLACIIPFILIYYFLIAANVWFAIFTYAWYLQTKDRGNMRDRIDKESFYFHFIAWALPLVLMVTIMVLSEVDGNSITGICFVGYRNRNIRIGLVLVPIAILSIGFSAFFSFKGCFNLNRIKRSTSTNKESKTLSSYILGMGIRTMLIVFFICAFFISERYEVRNADLWATSLKDLIICKIKEVSGEDTRCKLQNRPSVAVLQLRLLCLFCVNLVISSWCWTRFSFKTWRRFLKKKMGYEVSEDEKIAKPKDQIIADAYPKRTDDVLSVTFQNSINDPTGLNFDVYNINLAESSDLRESFIQNLPNMLRRRNAVTAEIVNEQNLNCVPYGNSFADDNSEISVSVQHFSIESRRNSFDSQVSQVQSVKSVQITSRLARHTQPDKKNVNMRSKKRKRSKKLKGKCKSPNNASIQLSTNMVNRQIERRSACTTAHISDIHQLLHYMQTNQTTIIPDDDQEEQSEISNMLVPFDAQQHRMNDSADSFSSFCT